MRGVPSFKISEMHILIGKTLQTKVLCKKKKKKYKEKTTDIHTRMLTSLICDKQIFCKQELVWEVKTQKINLPETCTLLQQSSKKLYLHHYSNFVVLVSVQVTDSLQNTVTIRPGSSARCFCERREGDVKTPV